MAVVIAAAADDNNIDAIRKVVKLLLDGKSVSEIFVDGNVGNISLERIKEVALRVQNENPMIKLGGPNVDAGRASVLNYRMQPLPSPESDGK